MLLLISICHCNRLIGEEIVNGLKWSLSASGYDKQRSLAGVVVLYVGVYIVSSDDETDVLSICACMCTHAQAKDVWVCTAWRSLSTWWCSANTIPTVSQAILSLTHMERDCHHPSAGLFMFTRPAPYSYGQHMLQYVCLSTGKVLSSNKKTKLKTN